MRKICLSLVFALLGTGALFAQDAGLVAPGAEVKRLATGFQFTEGPAANAEGDVFFTDIPTNRILKWSVADAKLSTFRENSGGANGLYFDKAGNLLACEGNNRQLTSIKPNGEVAILADQYEGKRFNSPNDLWIDPKGGVYFTDPRYGRRDNLEMGGFFVFYLSPEKKLSKVIDDLKMPNGIIGTPDGKTLYVADNGAGVIIRYSIGADGSLSEKAQFCKQRSDGLTLDERGNLYTTDNKNQVVIYDPSGKQIDAIKVPEGPANVSFGGQERKTLFITAQTSLYSVDMAVRGTK